MTEIESSYFMIQALSSLRTAVADALEKKAKLGQKAVVCKDGKTCIVSAKTLVQQLKRSSTRLDS